MAKARRKTKKPTSPKSDSPRSNGALQSNSPRNDSHNDKVAASGRSSTKHLKRVRFDATGITGAPVSAQFVGDITHSEFQPALGILQTQALLSCTSSFAATVTRLHNWAPELLIVGQRFPGEWTPDAIKQLQSASSTARTILIDGAACEGEGRSGAHHTDTWRVYWHQAAQVLNLGLSQRAAGRSAWWSYPPELKRLAIAQTRWVGDVEEPSASEQPQSGVAIVVSDNPDFAQLLADIVRAKGLEPLIAGGTQLSHFGDARLILWDCDSADEVQPLLQHLKANARVAPMVVLAGALRTEDFSAIQESNIVLLGKPFDLASLNQAMESALDQSQQPARGLA